ncbi:MAG: sulfoxide reductase heme-binding subunit YedZ [Gammaproteobacteria bacterium]|nr:sulfoxide reductase heme-binding subunit YedZ [Gammaproteobacteria bacterium]MCP4089042.1 sulfoxide reductase heme-binding subunit YedZ [Gammaproteobacteria bacterium]MCP4278058.1 sulfoxide reductase heme-binding subunit YedZ [Gammaproteobacteria bacterium]MCP4833034.1 sulfoxide reductase heme-binding subunit YedZ [Gammaproteobacteria bacterium]MCP4929011.1 sulfoxide reductase heme-binding subunit YedZ [Gammaproteobacteria bacterium]
MAFPNSQQVRQLIKPLWFSACLLPFLLLLFDAFTSGGRELGANPIEAIQDRMGLWALRFLLLTLSLTPLRQLTGQAWLQQLRRMTGLFALFYVSMHFLNYLVLDQGFGWSFIIEDVLKRPFITLGMLGLLCLIPLGITSTTSWRRKLGRRWQKLHRLIYLIAILGCWHFWWQVKSDIEEPLLYSLMLAVLLGFRLWKIKLAKKTTPG